MGIRGSGRTIKRRKNRSRRKENVGRRGEDKLGEESHYAGSVSKTAAGFSSVSVSIILLAMCELSLVRTPNVTQYVFVELFIFMTIVSEWSRTVFGRLRLLCTHPIQRFMLFQCLPLRVRGLVLAFLPRWELETATNITLYRPSDWEMPIYTIIHSFIHSCIQAISVAPFQVCYNSKALPTQHGYCAGVHAEAPQATAS